MLVTVLIIIAVLVAGVLVATKFGLLKDEDKNGIPDAVDAKVDQVKVKVEEVKAKVEDVKEDVAEVVKVVKKATKKPAAKKPATKKAKKTKD